jgi:ACS family glucarate transporter-like MFS transporter
MNMAAMEARLSVSRPGVRHLILLTLFVVSTVGYADRAALGIVGMALSRSFGFDSVAMGYILSASAVSYLLCQIPGGALLDRFGSRWIYAGAIALFSIFTMAQGTVSLLTGTAALVTLLLLRLGFGMACAPAIPANARITASWFPAAERGFATAVFNSAQYFALAAFAPLIGWVAHVHGWPWAFYLLGMLGLGLAALFPFVMQSPLHHPLIGRAERAHIESHGALVHIEAGNNAGNLTWRNLRQVAFDRLLLGLYLFQYCIGVLPAFFMTWFPIYLIQQHGLSLLRAGLVMALVALFGFLGNICGGLVSDAILRHTGSLTLARKLPAAAGFVLALSVLACDVSNADMVIIIAASATFFGKGFAALGWTMVSDCSPQELLGVTAGLFNMAGNIAAVITPIVVGHLVGATHSFDGAIIFVAAHCLLGLFALFALIGRIHRIQLQPVD